MLNIKGKLKQSLVGLALLSVSTASFAVKPFGTNNNNNACYSLTFGYYDTGTIDSYTGKPLFNHCLAAKDYLNNKPYLIGKQGQICTEYQLFFKFSKSTPFSVHQGVSLGLANSSDQELVNLSGTSNLVVGYNPNDLTNNNGWASWGWVHALSLDSITTPRSIFMAHYKPPGVNYECQTLSDGSPNPSTHQYEKLTFTYDKNIGSSMIFDYAPQTSASPYTGYDVCNGGTGGWNPGDAIIVQTSCNLDK